MTFDTRTEAGVAKWRRFSREIAELVVKYNGSLSGEHGDGQAKAEFLPIMFGDNLMQAFRRFKQAWDPERLMNPGKLIDAYRMDENLRLGPDYNTPVFDSVLHFTEDAGGFGRSTERCIGMGKCRAQTGAMCPSFQATGEERFSTRGRAHLLHELLRKEVIPSGFEDTDIAESLEHCLSCKACKTECPTHVDIAAFKAEFMAQHYKLKKRPLHHHVFGKAGQWLPLMTRFPKLCNALQTGIPGRFLKSRLGLDKNKSLPVLDNTPFKKWAVTVLVAKSHFCCGRPLYEHGFLDKARQQLNSILDNFYSRLPENATVLVLEPSCLSVFKDELHRLFPDDARATDLDARTMTVAEFLSSQGLME